MFTLGDIGVYVWQLITRSRASQYRASLELCRDRNAELLVRLEALRVENESLRRCIAVRESEIPEVPCVN